MEEITPNQDGGGKSHFSITQILLLFSFSCGILQSSELALVTAGLLSPLLSWASHSQISSFDLSNIFLLNPTSNTCYP